MHRVISYNFKGVSIIKTLRDSTTVHYQLSPHHQLQSGVWVHAELIIDPQQCAINSLMISIMVQLYNAALNLLHNLISTLAVACCRVLMIPRSFCQKPAFAPCRRNPLSVHSHHRSCSQYPCAWCHQNKGDWRLVRRSTYNKNCDSIIATITTETRTKVIQSSI